MESFVRVASGNPTPVAVKLARILGLTILLTGCVILLGYAFELPYLYRPLPNGTATHPLTAVLFLFAGLCLSLTNTSILHRKIVLALCTFSILLSSLPVVDQVTQINIVNSLTPFADAVKLEKQRGLSNEIGINTAFMFLFAFLSILAALVQEERHSQSLAMIAFFIPLLSLIGYAFGLGDFYGQMSLITTIQGLVLGGALSLMSFEYGLLKILLSPTDAGKLARKNTLLMGVCLTVVMVVLVKVAIGNQGNALGIVFTILYWMAIGIVAIGFISTEKMEENQFLKSMLYRLQEGICVIDHRYQLVEANQKFADMLGYDMHEIQRLYIWDWDAAYDKERIQKNFHEIVNLEASFFTKHRRKDGSIYTAEVTAAGAKIMGQSMMLCVVRDVTEAEANKTSLKDFRSIVDKTIDCVFIFDPETLLFTYTNKGAESQVGYSSKELSHLHPYDIKPEFDELQFKEMIEPLISGEKTILNFDTLHQHKNGGLIDVSVNLQLVSTSSGENRFVAVVRDISEKKMLEEKLRHSQKMEAIGRIAGGVAHDFNNQLAAIMGFAELVLTTDKIEHARHCAQKIIVASELSSKLTRQLLTFSRKDNLNIERFDLHELLSEIQEIFQSSFDKKVVVKVELVAQKSMIAGDRSLLKMALLNLGINANDAMPHGGLLGISTSNIPIFEIDENRFEVTSHEFGEISSKDKNKATEGIELIIQDTGYGIEADKLSLIFEPFYTTKSMGEGTGLGLASVLGAVDQMHGKIHVESIINEGTMFKITLPLSENQNQVKTSAKIIEHSCAMDSYKILFVDDEDALRELCGEYLELLGQNVVLAKDGQEALKLFQSHDDFDLIITDMIMPSMDGKELCTAIRAVNESIPLVVASGFTNDKADEDLQRLGVIEVMSKPFKLDELKAVIERFAMSGLKT